MATGQMGFHSWMGMCGVDGRMSGVEEGEHEGGRKGRKGRKEGLRRGHAMLLLPVEGGGLPGGAACLLRSLVGNATYLLVAEDDEREGISMTAISSAAARREGKHKAAERTAALSVAGGRAKAAEAVEAAALAFVHSFGCASLNEKKKTTRRPERQAKNARTPKRQPHRSSPSPSLLTAAFDGQSISRQLALNVNLHHALLQQHQQHQHQQKQQRLSSLKEYTTIYSPWPRPPPRTLSYQETGIWCVRVSRFLS
ncbi:hypothetical protein FN846DRAFT_809624, partial [Sphaerosporella brunnea]